MVKIIMGVKGMGKTKMLIDMVNESVKTEQGNVVCIEAGNKLTYDINHDARLVDITEFGVTDFDMFYGFISGLLAGNHDITAIYVDSIFKFCKQPMADFDRFIKKVDELAEAEGIKMVITASADVSEATDYLKKFM